MIGEVEGAVAVVTGAAGGLGLGLARQLGARGARIVMADIDEGTLRDETRRLTEAGIEAIAVPTDVTDAASVDGLARIAAEVGPVSILCSNAGVSVLGRAWELAASDWEWVYGVNVAGTVNMIRSFVPGMIERGPGNVIVTVSNTAVTARARYALYGSSKHAALSICESLELDLRETGSAVKVTAVLPGPIRSRMARTHERRPPGHHADGPPPDEVEAIDRYLAEHGVDPDVLASGILDAIDEGRFYVFTHPANVAMVRERAGDIERGFIVLRTQAPV